MTIRRLIISALFATLGWVLTAQDILAADPVEIPYLEQWRMSPHAKKDAEAFRHWDKDGAVPKECATCHSHGGYLDFLGADGSEPDQVDKAHATDTVIGCTTCHNEETLKLVQVKFPSGAVIKDAGRSMRCMVCHQGRVSGPDVHRAHGDLPADKVSENVRFQNVHYRAAAATTFGTLVKGGYEYSGQSYAGEYTHAKGYRGCTDCHDAHTTQVREEVCAVCHKEAQGGRLANIRMFKADFDGDGSDTEGLAQEIEGLHAQLLAQMQAYAKETAGKPITHDSHNYPYFFTDVNGNGKPDKTEVTMKNKYLSWTPRLAKAAYNYQFVAKDPGGFTHNGKYIVQLLHDSIADLGGDVSKMARP